MDQTAQTSPNPPLPFAMHHVYNDDLSNAKRATGAFSLTDAAPAGVPWLWPGRIPLGSVTLLVSDPGIGKSLLALDIAARVTTGRPWPDVGARSEERGASCNSALAPRSSLLAPSSVLLINIEDHFRHTIRPRLDALGADCSRIIGWTYARGELFMDEPHLFALTRDLGGLSKLIEAMQDCRLVILDPITALLGDASDQSSADAWKLLAALAGLARKHNFAVLVVSHLRKKEGAAIHRALGSLAYVAAARAVWTLAKDPADPNKRLFLPLKNNLAPNTPGLAFTIETHEPTQAAIIRWLPEPIESTADTALTSTRPGGRPDDERLFAVQWLLNYLAIGRTPMREVRDAADAHGISYGTLRRAFRQLGGEAIFEWKGSRPQWDWKLPEIGAQNPRGEICAPIEIPDEVANCDRATTTSHRDLTSDNLSLRLAKISED